MATAARLLTYDDLLAMPEDGKQYEILDGRLIELTSPELVHQLVSGWFYRTIYGFVIEHKLGQVFYAPLDVRLSAHNIVQPDIVYVSYARFGNVRRRPIEGAPDLVVELLSPSTRARDLDEKKEIYARHGVPEYWVVDIDARTLTIFSLIHGRYEDIAAANGLVRSRVLTGLEIDLAAPFADIEE